MGNDPHCAAQSFKSLFQTFLTSGSDRMCLKAGGVLKGKQKKLLFKIESRRSDWDLNDRTEKRAGKCSSGSSAGGVGIPPPPCGDMSPV